MRFQCGSRWVPVGSGEVAVGFRWGSGGGPVGLQWNSGEVPVGLR